MSVSSYPAAAPELLTPDDLCAALKISRRTLARLVACGLPPAVTVNSRRRYRLPDVEAWLREREQRAARALSVRRPVRVVDPTALADLREMARTWIARPVRRVR